MWWEPRNSTALSDPEDMTPLRQLLEKVCGELQSGQRMAMCAQDPPCYKGASKGLHRQGPQSGPRGSFSWCRHDGQRHRGKGCREEGIRGTTSPWIPLQFLALPRSQPPSLFAATEAVVIQALSNQHAIPTPLHLDVPW